MRSRVMPANKNEECELANTIASSFDGETSFGETNIEIASVSRPQDNCKSSPVSIVSSDDHDDSFWDRDAHDAMAHKVERQVTPHPDIVLEYVYDDALIFKPWWVLMPTSKVRRVWDTIVFALLVWTVAVVPVRFAFYAEETYNWLDIVVDALFFIDIVATFLTVVETDGAKYVVSPREVARRYLKGWFAVDLISTFPFYLMGESSVSRASKSLRVSKFLKALRLMRLMKLIRIYRLGRFFEKLEHSPRMHAGFLRVLKLMVAFVVFAHGSACVWYYIGESNSDSSDNWITRFFFGAPVENRGRKYLTAVYYTLTTLSTVGFGDLTARTNEELLFTIGLMLLGATLFSLVTAIFSSIIVDSDTKTTNFRRNMSALKAFIKRNNLSLELAQRLLTEMSAQWRNPDESVEWEKLAETMPKELRFETSMELHKKTVEASAFFQMFDTEDENSRDMAFVVDIMSCFCPATFYPGQYLGTAGDRCTHFSLIVDGEVAVKSTTSMAQQPLRVLTRGSICGDIALFLGDRWTANYQARSVVHVLQIHRDVLFRVIARNSHVSPRITEYSINEQEELMRLRRARHASPFSVKPNTIRLASVLSDANEAQYLRQSSLNTPTRAEAPPIARSNTFPAPRGSLSSTTQEDHAVYSDRDHDAEVKDVRAEAQPQLSSANNSIEARDSVDMRTVAALICRSEERILNALTATLGVDTAALTKSKED